MAIVDGEWEQALSMLYDMSQDSGVNERREQIYEFKRMLALAFAGSIWLGCPTVYLVWFLSQH